MFPAGDPFLTSRHQETYFFFPCNALISLMVSGAQEGNNRLLFYSAHEPTKRLLVGVEEGAELWVGRTVMWLYLCPSPPSILEGAG